MADWIEVAMVPLVALVAALGQAPEPPPFLVEVERVLLSPVVLHRGRPVLGLAAADFLVLDGGRRVELEAAAPATGPLDVAIAIDVSDSMAAVLDGMRRSAAGLTGLLAADDLVRVTAFRQVRLGTFGPARDRAGAAAAIAGLRAGGGTALLPTLEALVEELGKSEARPVLVVFTDGEDGTRDDPSRVAGRAAALGVPVYAVIPSEAGFEPHARRALTLISEQSGGGLHVASSKPGLLRAFADVIEHQRARYRLSYAPPPGKAGLRKVEVRVADGRYRVRCRKRYRHDGT